MSLFRKKDPFGDGSPAAGKKPKSRARIVLIGLLITLVFGLIYFYFALPAINLQNPQFLCFYRSFVRCFLPVLAVCIRTDFGKWNTP